MTTPRDIRFPKDKDKLKFDLPSVVNFKKNIEDIEADLTPSKSPEFFNLREEMRFVLKNIKLKPSSSFDSDNQNLTNFNSIIFSFNGNPTFMNEDQFLEAAYRDWETLGNLRDWETDRKSTRLNSSHSAKSRMPSSA